MKLYYRQSTRQRSRTCLPTTLQTLFALCQIVGITTSFLYQPNQAIVSKTCSNRHQSLIYMAKASKKKKAKKSGGGGGGSSGLKGFGSVGSSSSSSSSTTSQVELDRSKQAMVFYDFMEHHNAGDNLNRCALGYFPLQDFKLRGVAALKPIKKGDPIIRIPYEMAVNLGQEGADPTIPAVELLRDYCEVLSSESSSKNDNIDEKAAYYRMLPTLQDGDCMGSPDFFSDQALEALQAPMIVEETLKRREKVNNRFQLDIASSPDEFPPWIDGSPVTAEHLLWAVWLVTSRVLTVQGSAEEGKSYRLLIPFLD
ncbi:MAG: hypothetical protein SGILL_007612, partial [Bacillariaceae sp.]